MARIPLSDIPNAPQPVAMPTGGNLAGVNFGRTQTILENPTIAQGSLDGQARGVLSIASAFSNIGEVSSRIANHLHDAEVATQTTQVESKYKTAWGNFQAKLAENPESDPKTWLPEWEGISTKINKEVMAMSGLSAEAKRKINDIGIKYWDETSNRLKIHAGEEIFKRGLSADDQRRKWALEANDFDGARTIIDSMAEKQRISPEQALGLHHDVNYRQDLASFTASMMADPEKAQQELSDETKYPHIPVIQRPKLMNQAETEQHRMDAEMWEAFNQGVEDKTIQTPEQARMIFGERFSARYSTKIKAKFDANPNWNQVIENSEKINQEIADLDPKDPDVIKKKTWLRVEINSSLPPGFRQDAIDYLDGKVNNKPGTERRAQLTKSLSSALKAGVFGSWNEKDVKNNTSELSKKNTANLTMYRIGQDGEAWLRQNPRASSEDLDAWLKTRMSREIKQAEPGVFSRFTTSYGNLPWYKEIVPSWGAASAISNMKIVTPAPTPMPLGNRIDEALKKHEAKPTPTPAPPSSKVTSYGYNGDSTPDNNSRNRIGAWDNTLHSDSLAVSPDVEQAFTAQGIKPDDWVELTLSDGTKVKKQWSDRTMSDEERIARGEQPLRGRYDFFSKDGKHAKDGISVKAFQKISNT